MDPSSDMSEKLILLQLDVNSSIEDEEQQQQHPQLYLHHDEEDEESDDESVESDDDFSFMCTGGDSPPISPADAFQDGQIKPVFPLFKRELLFSNDPSENPAVDKIFIESPNHASSSQTEKNEGIAEGPYCVWSKKEQEFSPEVCDKSNSTGFSKLWRFKEHVNRSNSDGRDAFVYLNKKKREDTSSQTKKPEDGDVKVKAKKVVRKKKAPLSAHEIYMRNKELHEDDRRRTYLPYRPGLVGFFTNVSGGLSRHVNPF